MKPRQLPATTLILGLLAGCTGTTYDRSLESAASTTAPPATTVPTGPPAVVLAALLDQARTMSAVISADGDDAAVLSAVQVQWEAVRADVEAERPELVADFDTAIRVLGTASRFDRAADADKASNNLAALVAAYTND